MNKKLITVYDDIDPLNNVVSTLTLQVEEVFYVYHHDVAAKNFENIQKVLNRYRNIKTNFIQLNNDKEEIAKIFSENEGILVDVSGAKYLSLLLFDMVKEKDNMILYYDDEENNIKDYRSHSIICDDVFKLQIEDVLNLRGGEIVEHLHQAANDKKTQEAVVKLVENNVDNYQAFVRYITKLNTIINARDALGNNTYQLKQSDTLELMSDAEYEKTKELFTIDKGNRLQFTTRKLKEMISVSGAFLENYLYIKLKESGEFDDIKMSVVIDFSDDSYSYPVRCELDCLVIKDNKLLFVSCKSSKADASTLNEIYVHNHRFGNALSLPVLCVCEELDRKYPSIYAKGEELNIYLVDRSSFEEGKISEVFASIFDGTYVYDAVI